MRLRNCMWSMLAVLVGGGIIAFVTDMPLRDFCLLTIGATGALAMNLTMWDE